MSDVSALGVEPTRTLVVTTALLSPVEGNLLGGNREVTTLNTNHIIPGCICGSFSKSLTVAMLEPSGWLIATWCSIIGLMGVVKVGALASIVVLFVGQLPGAVEFCLWTLLHV